MIKMNFMKEEKNLKSMDIDYEEIEDYQSCNTLSNSCSSDLIIESINFMCVK